MSSYNKVRKISFAIYLVLSILFAVLLLHLGWQDVRRASDFAETERTYIENLMNCSSALDRSIRNLKYPFDTKTITNFYISFEEFRRRINGLSDFTEQKKISKQLESLKKNCALIASALDSVKKNLEENSLEKNIILKEDFNTIWNSLSHSSELMHELISSEYELAVLWQGQSLFFFRRLQYMLVTFFILTTLFFVISSSYSWIVLKRYLKHLSEGTKQISRGNLQYRFTGIEADEMGALMADFNSMASRLEQQTHELTEINKKLEEKANQLLEAHMHKDRFFANMSHELRTPLSAIIGFSELNLSNPNYPREKMIENSRRILEAAEHLLSLISGLLDIAKLDASMLIPNFKQQKIQSLIKSVCEMMKTLASKKGLQFEIEKLEDSEFSFDDKMVRQVLINIIGNAIKFTHKGWVKIRAFNERDFYCIEVEDTGIGISEKDQKKIFTDFHRAESGLTSNYEGVGLGLALSKRLVNLHNGSIEVQSKLGYGSIFKVRLAKK